MRYVWTVIEQNGEVNSGVVATFQEAICALKDWQGDPTHDPPHLAYTITVQASPCAHCCEPAAHLS